MLVGVLVGWGDAVRVGSIVKPGVGVSVGNIWAAPTQEEVKIETNTINVIGNGELVILILVRFESYVSWFNCRTSTAYC